MKTLTQKYIVILLAAVALFSACKETEVDQTVEEILSAQPTIESFEPASADVMDLVTVQGTFLNFIDKAYVGDTECEIYRKVNSQELVVRVNPMAKSGTIKLVTKAANEAVTATNLTVTYATPTVSSSIPAEKLVNETIILEGERLDVVTKVMFGANEGIIEFKEANALVVKVPYSSDDNNDISMTYYGETGATSQTLKTGFTILIPKPTISVWPSLLNTEQGVSIPGVNMNLVQGVMFGDTEITAFAATAETLSFDIPTDATTGFYKIKLSYADGEEVSDDIPYIASKYLSLFDYNDGDISSVEVNKADYALLSQLNGDLAAPTFPKDGNYVHLEQGKESSSTVFKQRFSKSANWDAYGTIENPVLHFWINTNNTTPDIQIEIIKNEKATLTEYNTGDNWVFVAVRLSDLFTSVADSYARFNYRNPGESDSEINMSYVIIAEDVLDGIGAVDLTDSFQ